MKIAILSIVSILFFGVIGLSSAYDENQFKLPLNRGILPRAENKQIVVWEGYLPTTKYSEKDSCHYKGCVNAMGKVPKIGTVACQRDWLKGSIVEINDQRYECQDRYNANLSDRVDIWNGFGDDAYIDALNYGVKIAYVKLIKK